MEGNSPHSPHFPSFPPSFPPTTPFLSHSPFPHLPYVSRPLLHARKEGKYQRFNRAEKETFSSFHTFLLFPYSYPLALSLFPAPTSRSLSVLHARKEGKFQRFNSMDKELFSSFHTFLLFLLSLPSFPPSLPSTTPLQCIRTCNDVRSGPARRQRGGWSISEGDWILFRASMERHSCMKIRLNSANADANNAAGFIRVLGRLNRRCNLQCLPAPTAIRPPPRLPVIFLGVACFLGHTWKELSDPPAVAASGGVKARVLVSRRVLACYAVL